MKIDFLARESHHIEHAEAIWEHIKNKGTFFEKRSEITKSDNPIVVVSYADLKVANDIGRDKIVFGEHGIGLTFFPPHPSYAGSAKGKENVRLLLCPNQSVCDAYEGLLPQAERVIIGVPKMDRWAKKKFRINKKNPTVAISFHWDGMAHLETRSAYPFYINDLGFLTKSFKEVIGHGHPRVIETLRPMYERRSIEVVEDFNEVIRRADVYVVDCGSTGFEFAFIGKPIVFMNCPYYEAVRGRKRLHNFRFWEYADIGPEVNSARELPDAIRESFDRRYSKRRKEAVKNIFTYLDGRCGRRAARAIEKLFKKGQKGRIESNN